MTKLELYYLYIIILFSHWLKFDPIDLIVDIIELARYIISMIREQIKKS